jgi:2-amino-4-hydroxy-6-hydroxymethyldihydropteridine diphosphokinase
MNPVEKGSRYLFQSVAIAIGSNLGDRRRHLDAAVDALALDLAELKCSSYLETQPVGVSEEHGPYLNAAVVGITRLSPRDLLERLLEIEQEQGRARPYPAAPRTLDLDLILYAGAVIDESELSVPHPRFRQREFVLAPLAEIAPDMIDPVTGMTVSELYRALKIGVIED